MVSSRVLSVLVGAAVVLLVAFSVLAAVSMLLTLGQDVDGADTIRWVALAVLMLLIVDLVCLVLALALNATNRPGGPTHTSEL